MKKAVVLVFLFVVVAISVHSQEKIYTVNLESRNKLVPLVNQSNSLISDKEYEKAIAILIKVNKSDSIISNVYDNLFKAAILSKNTSDSVLNCLQTGKRVYAKYAEMSYFVAEIYRLRQNYSQAIDLYTEAIEQSNSTSEKSFYYPSFFKNRAYCYSMQKKYNAALSDYTVFLKSNNSDAAIFMNRALCYFNIGDKKRALEDFKISLNLGNKSAQQHIDKLTKKH